MKLNCRILGEEGKPLIILHGLFGMSDNWFTLGKRFSEKFQVFLVDQRNHGSSLHSSEFNYELMAMDLNELIEELEIERPILLGHSMGGKTALKFADLYPGVLEKMIVVDIAPKKYPPHHHQILEGINGLDLSILENRKMADVELAKYIEDFGVRQFLLKNLYRVEREYFAWRFNLEVLTREIHEVVVEIKINKMDTETLFIRGASSNYILDEDIDEIRAVFKHVDFATIEKAGHWVHAEKPQEFYSVVVEFCERN